MCTYLVNYFKYRRLSLEDKTPRLGLLDVVYLTAYCGVLLGDIRVIIGLLIQVDADNS